MVVRSILAQTDCGRARISLSGYSPEREIPATDITTRHDSQKRDRRDGPRARELVKAYIRKWSVGLSRFPALRMPKR